MPEALIYTRRPGGHALWLTAEVAKAIHAKDGDELTEAQFQSEHVTDLITQRSASHKKTTHE